MNLVQLSLRILYRSLAISAFSWVSIFPTVSLVSLSLVLHPAARVGYSVQEYAFRLLTYSLRDSGYSSVMILCWGEFLLCQRGFLSPFGPIRSSQNDASSSTRSTLCDRNWSVFFCCWMRSVCCVVFFVGLFVFTLSFDLLWFGLSIDSFPTCPDVRYVFGLFVPDPYSFIGSDSTVFLLGLDSYLVWIGSQPRPYFLFFVSVFYLVFPDIFTLSLTCWSNRICPLFSCRWLPCFWFCFFFCFVFFCCVFVADFFCFWWFFLLSIVPWWSWVGSWCMLTSLESLSCSCFVSFCLWKFPCRVEGYVA